MLKQCSQQLRTTTKKKKNDCKKRKIEQTNKQTRVVMFSKENYLRFSLFNKNGYWNPIIHVFEMQVEMARGIGIEEKFIVVLLPATSAMS